MAVGVVNVVAVVVVSVMHMQNRVFAINDHVALHDLSSR